MENVDVMVSRLLGHSSVTSTDTGVDLWTSHLTLLWVLLTNVEEEQKENCANIIILLFSIMR